MYKYNKFLTKEKLNELYHIKNYSVNKISSLLNINRITITQYMKRLDISFKDSWTWSSTSKKKITGKLNHFYGKTHNDKNRRIFSKISKTRINELNPMWKGDKVSYRGLHQWITNHYGKASKCEAISCNGKSKKYEWANISGNYKRERNDFMELCKSCHRLYDNKKRECK